MFTRRRYFVECLALLIIYWLKNSNPNLLLTLKKINWLSWYIYWNPYYIKFTLCVWKLTESLFQCMCLFINQGSFFYRIALHFCLIHRNSVTYETIQMKIANKWTIVQGKKCYFNVWNIFDRNRLSAGYLTIILTLQRIKNLCLRTLKQFSCTFQGKIFFNNIRSYINLFTVSLKLLIIFKKSSHKNDHHFLFIH